jgi:hypothetical protein
MNKISRFSTLITLVFFAFLALGASVSTAFAGTDGVLGVTHISAVQTSATPDGSFTNGWKWMFDVTVPTSETVFSMKFADWTNGSNTIPTGSNVRFYSAQSSDSYDENHAVTLSAANTYSTAINLDPSKDLNASVAGRQIQVTVEMRIPVGSAGGSYSTSYGVQSTPYNAPPPPPLAACTLPWGGTIESGNSVTAYQAATVNSLSPSSAACEAAAQTRTCNDGTLSGDYTSQSCSVTVPPTTVTLSLSPNPVPYGEKATLSWTSTYATRCTAVNFAPPDINHLSSGSVLTDPITFNFSYTLQCFNDNISQHSPPYAVVDVVALPAL